MLNIDRRCYFISFYGKQEVRLNWGDHRFSIDNKFYAMLKHGVHFYPRLQIIHVKQGI